ncbi:MAG: right-handed parallel beta-helix repeat-containing protein, partial [Methanosarcinales archaeon]|nr:right-handed parallel beta-helix repeat-containing protein [Methanosarcinales archaeon]
YHNMTVFTTDSIGRYTYTQDISKRHYVFFLPGSGDMVIQSGPDIKFINDGATGGDCTSIGNWDPGTKTCTLTTDFSGTIQIDSDDITLDGNGHTLTGSNTGDGVFICDSSGFTIRDLEIHDFTDGIFCMPYYNTDSGHENYVIDNTIYNNYEGISFCYWSDYSKTTINGNTISDNDHGIFLHFSSDDIMIIDNIIHHNVWGIVSFDESEDNIIIDNTIYENSIGILFDQNCCGNITNNNFFDNSYSGISLCRTGGHIIKDNIISNNQNGITLGDMVSGNDITSNSISNNDCGIYAYSDRSTCDNTINANTISNNDYGIYMETYDDSNFELYNNHITDNTISNNNYGLYILRACDNFFYHNYFINNIHLNAYEYLETGSNDWDDGTIGNLWSNYDEPCELCIDANNNGICDAPYPIPGGSGIDHYPITWIHIWISEGSDGGSAVTTTEPQSAIHHYLENIPVRGHILSLEDIQYIIDIWLGG